MRNPKLADLVLNIISIKEELEKVRTERTADSCRYSEELRQELDIKMRTYRGYLRVR